MTFAELKQVINRHPGRHDKIAIAIGLETDAIIEAESPLLDCLDDYEVAWIAPGTVGLNIEVHLKEKENSKEETE